MAIARVLLVDDETEFTAALADRMEARELEVDTAASGAIALDKVREHHYDAIVLDLQMPDMDGLETLKRLLDINPDLQVIMLTGHGSVKQGVEAVKQGAVDFLEKPADIETLMSKIREAQVVGLQLFEQHLDRKISDIVRKKSW